jgi:hypothetical protein
VPTGVFDLIVRRIVNSDPLWHIAQYLRGIRPGVSEATFRKWLQALAKQIKVELAQKKTGDQVLEAIEDFDKAQTGRAVCQFKIAA